MTRSFQEPYPVSGACRKTRKEVEATKSGYDVTCSCGFPAYEHRTRGVVAERRSTDGTWAETFIERELWDALQESPWVTG